MRLCNSTVFIQIHLVRSHADLKQPGQLVTYNVSMFFCLDDVQNALFCNVKKKKKGINSQHQQWIFLSKQSSSAVLSTAAKAYKIQLWNPAVPFSFYYSLCVCVWVCVSVCLWQYTACAVCSWFNSLSLLASVEKKKCAFCSEQTIQISLDSSHSVTGITTTC